LLQILGPIDFHQLILFCHVSLTSTAREHSDEWHAFTLSVTPFQAIDLTWAARSQRGDRTADHICSQKSKVYQNNGVEGGFAIAIGHFWGATLLFLHSGYALQPFSPSKC
jgi:hypothetical protein